MDLHPVAKNRRGFEGQMAKTDPIRRALHESEDWYQDLIDHSQDLLCVHDLEGRLLSISPAPARLLGYSVEEMLGSSMREFVAPEFRNEFDAYLKQVECDGEAKGLMIVVSRSGERRIWEFSNTLRREETGRAFVSGIARDVTEQRHTEKLLDEATKGLLHRVQENERVIREMKLFRTLVDHSSDAIEVVDPETLRFLDVNEKACSDLDYGREELLSLRVFDIYPAVTEASIAKTLASLRESGSLVIESLRRRKDGTTFPVEVSMRRVQLEREYVIAISRDLTARKESEAQLQASEGRYRSLYVSSPVGIAWVDQTGHFRAVNPKFCEIAGRTEEDLLERNFQSITHPDDVAENTEKLRQLCEGEVRHYEMEKRYIRADGSVRWVEIEVVPISPEGDGSGWHMAMVQDITERKRDQERLREYERVVEGLEEMIVVVDRDYRCVIANRAYLNYRGLEKGEVVGRLALEQIRSEGASEGTLELVEHQLEKCFRGKSVQYDLRHNYPDRGERDLHVLYLPIEGATGVSRIACVVQDVTERKQAEEALRTSERQQSKIAKQLEIERARLIEAQAVAKVGSWEIELSSLEVTWSEQTHRIFETDPAHFHPTRSDFLDFIHPEDLPKVEAAFKVSLDQRAPSTVEYRIVMADGRVKVLEERWKVFRDDRERPLRLVGTCHDVTERNQADEALRRSEENYRNFVSQSSEGIFRQDTDAPIPIDVPEDELIHHILYDHYMAECNDALAAMYGFKSGKELQGKRLTEMVLPEDPRNIELTRDFVRSGFRVIDRESHEVDIHGNPKVFLNSMIGTVENGRLVRTWGITRDVTEQVKGEESRRKAEEELRHTVGQLQEVTEELRQAKEKLSEEKLYLEQTIDSELGFGEIIGSSQALKEVMEKVARVAPSDATVLLLGETGTGKELVARALHRLSGRHASSFIKMNCAAIPSGLLESELFGHEKGAFTGAVARKIGRLELADHGTLFLDEIGEIHLSLQPKLLRVLQDHEFERLGGTQTLKVDFRLLAATNRDLLQSVKGREFRSDLYYRLNVFPIVIPPLRERREDIRHLVEYFVHKFATQMKKSITRIPSKTMEILVRWGWPGNIRELENFVERSVILTQDSVLQAPLFELQSDMESGNGSNNVTLREQGRERIIRTLRECRGKLGGADGAAARLGLKRTTLQSKLDNFGIKPADYRK
jgi:PAS domain S-box-containing protein